MMSVNNTMHIYEIVALLLPEQRRIYDGIKGFYDEFGSFPSVRVLAKRIGRPYTTMYHHLQRLLDTGLVEKVDVDGDVSYRVAGMHHVIDIDTMVEVNVAAFRRRGTYERKRRP
jgi:DNA-binding transcriptional ArsR family regulator